MSEPEPRFSEYSKKYCSLRRNRLARSPGQPVSSSGKPKFPDACPTGQVTFLIVTYKQIIIFSNCFDIFREYFACVNAAGIIRGNTGTVLTMTSESSEC